MCHKLDVANSGVSPLNPQQPAFSRQIGDPILTSLPFLFAFQRALPKCRWKSRPWASGTKPPPASQMPTAMLQTMYGQSEPPDWRQIALLYYSLLRLEPTLVVQLNRAVALAEAGTPEAGLRVLESLALGLATYQPFHAAHAELLSRCGEPAPHLPPTIAPSILQAIRRTQPFYRSAGLRLRKTPELFDRRGLKGHQRKQFLGPLDAAQRVAADRDHFRIAWRWCCGHELR